MSIEYYVDTDAPIINVMSLRELIKALDILRSQVIDNINKDSKVLRVLEYAIEQIDIFRLREEAQQ